eukprot:TRINITY_DN13438_c1_g1_i1.p1 TRINITY_DN13438_c1_g1~~TRINITY_DN13438_c1_g1_i1.p1  ORF type:complete len:2874 (+),score=872.16 TRINITY_DN13438_c1_g1_i1:70-8622(+)
MGRGLLPRALLAACLWAARPAAGPDAPPPPLPAEPPPPLDPLQPAEDPAAVRWQRERAAAALADPPAPVTAAPTARPPGGIAAVVQPAGVPCVLSEVGAPKMVAVTLASYCIPDTATMTIKFTAEPPGLVNTATNSGSPDEVQIPCRSPQWQTPGILQISPIDNKLVDGNKTLKISAVTTGTDDPYYKTQTASFECLIVDDDKPGVTVTAGGDGNLWGATQEDGKLMSAFTMVLTSKPTADVQVTVTVNDTTEGSMSASGKEASKTYTFTPDDWDKPQVVTVFGVDDFLNDHDVTYQVTLSDAVSADPVYNGRTPTDGAEGPPLPDNGFVVNKDDDEPAAQVTPKCGLVTTESSKPNTIMDPNDLLLNPLEYRGQPRSVSRWTDDPQPADYPYGSDTCPGGNASEVYCNTGSNDYFLVWLTSQPYHTVTITLNSSNPAEGLPEPDRLTFEPSTWNVPQTVKVIGQDDDIADCDQMYSVGALSESEDKDYHAQPNYVQVINRDDDGKCIQVTTAKNFKNANPCISTAESTVATRKDTPLDGIANISLTLSKPPAPGTTVSVPIYSSDVTEGFPEWAQAFGQPNNRVQMEAGVKQTTPTIVEFTDANWNIAQTVVIFGQHDSIHDGDQNYELTIGPVTDSGDPDYLNKVGTAIMLSNKDDEAAGVQVTPDTVYWENNTAGRFEFEVVLLSEPVQGTCSSNNGWLCPHGQNPSYTSVTDVHVLLCKGAAPCEVANGTFKAAGEDEFKQEGVIDVMMLTFDRTNWNVSQTITLTPVDEWIDDGDQPLIIDVITATKDPEPPGNSYVSFRTNAAGWPDVSGNVPPPQKADPMTAGWYGGPGKRSQSPAKVTSRDNDTSAVVVEMPSAAGTAAGWGSGAGWEAYMCCSPSTKLGPELQESIGCRNSPSASAPAAQCYPGTAPVLSEAARNQTLFGVRLDSEPIGSVNVTFQAAVQPSAARNNVVVSVPERELVAHPAVLNFDDKNWNTPQTVTVTGRDDWIDDGDQTVTLTLVTGAPGDPVYAAMHPIVITHIVTDNDTVGMTVTPVPPADNCTTTEQGGPRSPTGAPRDAVFQVVLHSQPHDCSKGAAPCVQVTADSSNKTEGDMVAALVFNDTNWNVPQLITVRGQDEWVDDPNVPYSVNFTARGMCTACQLADYSAFEAVRVWDSASCTNYDDDRAGLNITAWSPAAGVNSLSEGSNATALTTEKGATAEVILVLTSEPLEPVTVTLDKGSTKEGSLSASNLTFDKSNWNVKQTVVVTGLDDPDHDGNVTWTLTVGPAASADPKYDGNFQGVVTVTNADDDVPGIAVDPLSVSVTEEGPGSATVTVSLATRPAKDVTLPNAVSSDDTEGVVSGGPLTFTYANWNVSQTLTLTAVDDQDKDGDVAYKINWDGNPTSDDGDYSSLTPDPIDATTVDNDVPGISCQPTTKLFTGEDGSSTTLSCMLRTVPKGTVTFSITLDKENECLFDTGPPTNITQWHTTSLKFTDQDWKVPQTVTVRGQDDELFDGPQNCTASFSPADSTDPEYSKFQVANIYVINKDNDTDPCSQYGGMCKDPTCSACCSYACGECGGDGCDARPGGKEECCDDDIFKTKPLCIDTKKAPCRRIDPCERFDGICVDSECLVCCPKSCPACGRAKVFANCTEGDPAYDAKVAETCCELPIIDAGKKCSRRVSAPCIRLTNFDCTKYGGICVDAACSSCCATSCADCGGAGCLDKPGGSACCKDGIGLCEEHKGICMDQQCTVCCSEDCAQCGGDQCAADPLGADKCCADTIFEKNVPCGTAPCRRPGSNSCERYGGLCADAACSVCCSTTCTACGAAACGSNPECCPDDISKAAVPCSEANKGKSCVLSGTPAPLSGECAPYGGICDASCSVCCPRSCMPAAGGPGCQSGDACTQAPRGSECCEQGIYDTGKLCEGGGNESTPCIRVNRCKDKTCPGPMNQCHEQGKCDFANGDCTTPKKPENSTCDDGDSESQDDRCRDGACLGDVKCGGKLCDPPNGTNAYCSKATCQGTNCGFKAKNEGQLCDDGVDFTVGDTCVNGECKGRHPCEALGGTCMDRACAVCCAAECGTNCGKKADGKCSQNGMAAKCCVEDIVKTGKLCGISKVTAPCLRVGTHCDRYGGKCADPVCSYCCAASCDDCGGPSCKNGTAAAECCEDTIATTTNHAVCGSIPKGATQPVQAPCMASLCSRYGGLCGDEWCSYCCEQGCEACGTAATSCGTDQEKCCDTNIAKPGPDGRIPTCSVGVPPKNAPCLPSLCEFYGEKCGNQACTFCCSTGCADCSAEKCKTDPLGADVCCSEQITAPCKPGSYGACQLSKCDRYGGICPPSKAECDFCCPASCGSDCGGPSCGTAAARKECCGETMPDMCSTFVTVRVPCRIPPCERYGGMCGDAACSFCCSVECEVCGASAAESECESGAGGEAKCCKDKIKGECSESVQAPCIPSLCEQYGGKCGGDDCGFCCPHSCSACSTGSAAGECSEGGVRKPDPKTHMVRMCGASANTSVMAPCVIKPCEKYGGKCKDEKCMQCCPPACAAGDAACCGTPPEGAAGICSPAVPAPCNVSPCERFGGKCANLTGCTECCSASCATCGGDTCADDPAGAGKCCPDKIRESAPLCGGDSGVEANAPCKRAPTCDGVGGLCADDLCEVCCDPRCAECDPDECSGALMEQAAKQACCAAEIRGAAAGVICGEDRDGAPAGPPCLRVRKAEEDDDSLPLIIIIIAVLLLLCCLAALAYHMHKRKKSTDDGKHGKQFQQEDKMADKGLLAVKVHEEEELTEKKDPKDKSATSMSGTARAKDVAGLLGNTATSQTGSRSREQSTSPPRRKGTTTKRSTLTSPVQKSGDAEEGFEKMK